MLRLIQHTLEKAGYELIPARTSQEARAALKEGRPDLVVGSASVVNEGVQQTLDEMRKKNNSGPIPVIHVSDAPTNAADEPGSHTGAVTFTKPFSPTKLLAEVKRLIEGDRGGAPS